MNPLKRLIGLSALILLSSCATPKSTDIVLQKTSANVYLTDNAMVPYRIEEVTEIQTVAAQTVIELPYASSRAGYSWLLSKVSAGAPAKVAVTYRITYDQAGNVLSKVKVPESETKIKAIPAAYQYGAKVAKGAYFYSRTISRYGFDCVGCEKANATKATMASLIQVSGSAVRQSDGTWKNGITYDGYYMVAADKAFPLCTVLEIQSDHFSGSGITAGSPFRVLVADRGGAITTNRLDLFVGTETNLDTIIHIGTSDGTKVTVVGFLKWKRNSLGQMTCSR